MKKDSKESSSLDENSYKDLFKTILEKSNNVMTFYDLTENKIILANDKWKEILGWSPLEIKNPFTLCHPDDAERVSKAISEVFTGKKKEIANLEYRYKTIKGEYRTFLVSITKTYFGNKPVLFTQGEDITEGKKVEERLKETNILLNTLSDNLPGFVAYVNADTLKYDYVNALYSKSFGIPINKIIGSHIKDVLGERACKFALKYIEEARKGKAISYENLIEMKGEKRWVKVNYAPGFDKAGKVISIIVLAYDITERKRIEKQLIDSEALFKQIFENMSSGVAIYEVRNDGKDFIIKNFNRTAEHMEKIRREDIIGKNVVQIFPGIKKFGLYDTLRKVWKTGKPKECSATQYKDDRISGWKENYVFKLSDNEVVAIYNDVTERKKGEMELKESEEKYKLLVDRMQEITVILDKTGKILFANKFTLETMGYTEKEFLGRSVFSFLTKSSIKQAAYNLAQEFLGKNTGSIEIEILTKKGEIRTIALSEASNPIYKGKKIAEILVNGIDITEQKKAEELNKNIIKCTSDWIWEVNLQGKYTYCSENVKEIIGYSTNEIIGKTPFDFMSKEESQRIGSIFEDILKKQEQIKDLENWNIHKDGSMICLLTNGFPIFDEKGKLKGYKGADKDITERKKAEMKLKESEEKYNAILDYSTDQIFMTDSNLKYLSVGSSLAKSLGKNPEDMINKSLIEVFGKSDEELRFMKNIKSVLQEGKDKIIDEEIILEGKKNYISTQLSPIKDSSGNITAVLGIVRNNTERKKAEEELKASRDILQEKIIDLERFNRISVDRELRMIELKEKIKELEEKLSKK